MLSMLFYSLLLVDFVTSQETAKQVPIENKVVTPDEVTDERNNNGWPITDGGGPTYNNQYFGYDPCETAVEIRRKNSQDKTWRNGNFGQGTFWYNPYPYWNNLRKTNVFFLTDYGNNMHCYHRFGSECRYGVQVWFRDFRLEAHTDQYCPWDYFAFGWTDTSGRRVYPSQKKNRYCGCFTNTYYGCRNLQNSLPEDNFDLLAIFTKYGRRTSWRPEIDNYNLIPPSFNVNTYVRRDIRWHSNKKIAGRDPVFTFKSDVSKYGGEIAVEWECTPYSASVTRTRVTVRRRTPLTQAVSAILALWSRSSVLSDMQESLLSNAKKVNPYGESADTNVTMSGDDNNIFAVIDFNGILDDTVALDKTVLARNVISATKNTMSSKKFNQFVDTRSISAKVELPPTITNTEQMADKLLDGSFEPQMALNYGCASQGKIKIFFSKFLITIKDTSMPSAKPLENLATQLTLFFSNGKSVSNAQRVAQ